MRWANKAARALLIVPASLLTITTYGMISRIVELENVVWDCLILDEAQAIKNLVTKQTKQIKKFKSRISRLDRGKRYVRTGAVPDLTKIPCSFLNFGG